MGIYEDKCPECGGELADIDYDRDYYPEGFEEIFELTCGDCGKEYTYSNYYRFYEMDYTILDSLTLCNAVDDSPFANNSFCDQPVNRDSGTSFWGNDVKDNTKTSFWDEPDTKDVGTSFW